MLHRLKRWSSTIHGQITGVIFACLVIAFVIGSTLESWVSDDYQTPDLESMASRVSVIAMFLANATATERSVIMAAANRDEQHLALRPLSYFNGFTTSSPGEPTIQVAIDRLLPPEGRPVPYGGWRTFVNGKRVVAAQVDEETLVVLEMQPERFLRNDALRFGSNYLVATVTLIVLFSIFAVWAITRPLRRIASAAMAADITRGPAVFKEQGSVEIVTLARALNAMQTRISAMMDARTRMLSGISHDLRTPLTRLRLRVERVKEDDLREGILSDVERIDRLLQESLNYLRDHHRREAFERADLASVLQTVCDEFADMGHDVSYSGPGRMIASFKPLAITRAITNLCENATKYASKVEVTLQSNADDLVIHVMDDGPGIAEEHRSRVLEPFFKIDTARGDKDAGFGLGLSIVAEIVDAHQGTVRLSGRNPTGLMVTITLPRRGQPSS